MTKKQLYLHLIFSGVLLSSGYYPFATTLLMFIAFIPLLRVEEFLSENKNQYGPFAIVKYSSITFAVWNLTGMWWVYNASLAGLIIEIIVGTLLMTIAFTAFHIVKRNLGKQFGYFSLIVFWLSFEHFFLNAEISNPWFTLGYGFQNSVKLIQWYEYTGALGGSFWILLINIIAFNTYKLFISKAPRKSVVSNLSILGFLLLVPIIISLTIFYTYKEEGKPYDVVVVQPNIDPYLKFNDIPSEEQTKLLIDLAEPFVDDSTDYVVTPETSINNNIWLHSLEHSRDIKELYSFIHKYPRLKYIVGITSYSLYKGEKPTFSARPLGNTGNFYDMHNSAIQLDTTHVVPVYHKSMLVSGVEKMPYAEKLQFLSNLTLKLGGTMRSHATQDYREVFYSPQDSTSIGTVICWESVFGEFVSEYIKAGANFIFIITNDGWWGNTPGHVQHNALASIRAIETRRSIARSANTGISSFVNQRGEMLKKLTWWQRGAIKETIYANDKITFYVKHGDYLARVSNFFSIIMILYLVTNLLIQKKKS